MTDEFNKAYELISGKLTGWLETIITNLPNLAIAIIVMVVFYYISKYVSRLVGKLVSKKVHQDSLVSIITKITAVAIIAIGLFLALGVLNLSKTLETLIGAAGVSGLVIGLALQGTLSNTFAGIVLSFRKSVELGHWVETNGYSGEVVEISLKNFVIKESDNNMVLIPNKSILENPLKNYSLTTKMRVFIECGVGYESDLDEVKRLTQQTIANEFDQVKKPEDVEFYYTEFGGSSINYLCRFWIESESMLEKLKAKTNAIIAIKKAYDKAGINIPFPIRTLQFDNKLAIDKEVVNKEFSNN
ncbi:mechanosensitive ion channel [Algibacter amylolyticus]|uniref:Mechanosensitive ion channel n=1 Tax=Algibacter amylolyticus TaxID=1608400 RepID=A0A5M7BAY5_9FLAO|nr:mechanosensitive ion channel [Algibacter amylolyticus]KAA5825548.1 mechanosensitive ion channel [Algibacter amylolyticus]MBB5268228.1 small conductance mechanosensitive channel [Algibacter amylolyticus]TSJ79846.1 mechanosensitive ion channel [Algibacter amylolyticus]